MSPRRSVLAHARTTRTPAGSAFDRCSVGSAGSGLGAGSARSWATPGVVSLSRSSPSPPPHAATPTASAAQALASQWLERIRSIIPPLDTRARGRRLVQSHRDAGYLADGRDARAFPRRRGRRDGGRLGHDDRAVGALGLHPLV